MHFSDLVCVTSCLFQLNQRLIIILRLLTVEAKFQANTKSHPAGINLLPAAQTGRQTFPHEATQANTQSHESSVGQSGRRIRAVKAVSQR